jgi:hypothetical protein
MVFLVQQVLTALQEMTVHLVLQETMVVTEPQVFLESLVQQVLTVLQEMTVLVELQV